MHGKTNERFLTVDGKRVVLNPAAVVDKLAARNITHEATPEHQRDSWPLLVTRLRRK
jgi:hypothetical protein